MSRYIDAEIIKLLMKQDRLLQGNCEYELWKQEVDRQVNALPYIDLADYVPKADRPQGEWVEKTKFHNADDDPIIEEWQSAKCSVCGKYHTTPYLYYFDDYNYCPNCGARMKGADDE